MESPVKAHFRMARTSTTVGEAECPRATVMLLPGHATATRGNSRTDTFRPDRRNVREHIAFIRGVHSCPWCTAGADRGPDLVEQDPRPDDRLQDLRGTPRSGGCTS